MDSDDEDEESNDMVDGVRAVWLLVERILGEDKGKYLVKWKKLPYDEATWEKASALFTEDDHAQIKRYKEHTKRYKLKNSAPAPRSAAARAEGGSGRAGGGGGGGGGAGAGAKGAQDATPDFLEKLEGGELFEYQREGVLWLRRKLQVPLCV